MSPRLPHGFLTKVIDTMNPGRRYIVRPEHAETLRSAGIRRGWRVSVVQGWAGIKPIMRITINYPPKRAIAA